MLREAPRRDALRLRALILVTLVLGGGLAPFALAGEDPVEGARAASCADPVTMKGVGTVCPRADGFLELLGPDGAVLGLTHGPDPVPSPWSDRALEGPTREAECVDPVQDPFHAIVFYARAVDDTDRYAQKAPVVRQLVERANHLLTRSAGVAGTTADFRVLCAEDGRVKVHEAVLPTPKSQASMYTILADLLALGHADPRTKLWVWYDDPSACACGGMALTVGDGSRGVGNGHNGNAPIPLPAVTFGYESVRIMMHEHGHTLGAVHASAPHATAGGHCWDGYDIMCYNDGSARGHLYRTWYCRDSMPFDCGNDDYFHPDPADGTHLDRYWNLASPSNRFVKGCFDASVLAAPPGETLAPVANAVPADTPVTDRVTFTIPDACRGHRATAWVVDAATENTVFHGVDVCWRDADGGIVSCDSDPFGVEPFPLSEPPFIVAEAPTRVPDVDGVTAEVRFTDAMGPVKVRLRVA